MSKYGEEFIKNSTILDNTIDAHGLIINLANKIVNENSKAATIEILKNLLAIVDNVNHSLDIKRKAHNVKKALIEFYGHKTLQEICGLHKTPDDKRTLQELLDELNELVGLEKVKNKVQDLIIYQKVQTLRQKKHLYSVKNTLHLAFTGNPGTGKTTVARIVGRIYKCLGLLSKGHFIEVSRTDLIAGYQGQTALKVKKLVEQAKGGVLFIDEAYSITENDQSDSYGKECLTELTKALEDYRDDLVVIVAGYTEPMNSFFDSNPGLKSRFNTFIEFDDYTPNELDEILLSMCKRNDYKLDEEAKKIIHLYFERESEFKKENFANGRLVRNLYDDLVMNHARRVINLDSPNDLDLSLIKKEDFQVFINQNSDE